MAKFKGLGKIVPNRHEVITSDKVYFEQNKLITEIFAPDPVTLNPRSDLHFMFSSDSSPVVSEFIRSTLARPVVSGSVTDDPDNALESMQFRGESSQDYALRLSEFIEKLNNV